MNWKLAENRKDPSTVEGKIFQGLNRLEQIRKGEEVFVSDADAWTTETGDVSVLSIGRYREGEKIIGLFNFSEQDKTIRMEESDEEYLELISGREMKLSEVSIPAYGFYYLKRK